MNNFNFVKEMVYGKKHMNKLCFDKKKYDFISEIRNLYNIELCDLHTIAKKKYRILTPDMLGKDSHTEFHKQFYKKLDTKWDELLVIYDRFITEVILPYLNLNEALVQVTPNLRVHLPDNKAIVIVHFDSDDKHTHPKGEINFIYALTDMYDTNTVMIEKFPRLKEFIPLIQKAGECTSFNGNLCSHYNNVNKTGKTRISFDFRILPLNFYNKDTKLSSVTTHKKYIEGGYYKRIFANKKNVYKARDIWDKEKEKFSSTMIKYGVSDAWGVVDIFERKMAEYAGSKYAISVDSCTDALFLCLKYLKAKGDVTLPSRTWISVPCTVIQAGCKVKFEDREWSGAYQLKPYPIYDGAVRMKKGMYKSETYHCLSFHIRKHLPIGKGGMILTDDKEAYDWFRTVRYEGRHIDKDGINYVMYKDDTMDTLGWNMYMTPEQAARGLTLMQNYPEHMPDIPEDPPYRDLTEFDLFKDIRIL